MKGIAFDSYGLKEIKETLRDMHNRKHHKRTPALPPIIHSEYQFGLETDFVQRVTALSSFNFSRVSLKGIQLDEHIPESQLSGVKAETHWQPLIVVNAEVKKALTWFFQLGHTATSGKLYRSLRGKHLEQYRSLVTAGIIKADEEIFVVQVSPTPEPLLNLALQKGDTNSESE